jgi:hypothetical protein
MTRLNITALSLEGLKVTFGIMILRIKTLSKMTLHNYT